MITPAGVLRRGLLVTACVHLGMCVCVCFLFLLTLVVVVSFSSGCVWCDVQVNNLIESFLEQARTIILCVIPANQVGPVAGRSSCLLCVSCAWMLRRLRTGGAGRTKRERRQSFCCCLIAVQQ